MNQYTKKWRLIHGKKKPKNNDEFHTPPKKYDKTKAVPVDHTKPILHKKTDENVCSESEQCETKISTSNSNVQVHSQNEHKYNPRYETAYQTNSTYCNENLKKMLCQNIIYYNKCVYGDKCLFAHSLDEQQVNDIRKNIYNIIDQKKDLTNFDIRENYVTYKSMLELTKLCKNCADKKCIGGYNCKSGACLKKYCICCFDLNSGYCKIANCDNIHLTKQGLKPYYNKKKIYNSYPINPKMTVQHNPKMISEIDNKYTDDDNGSDISDVVINDEPITHVMDATHIATICEQSIFTEFQIFNAS